MRRTFEVVKWSDQRIDYIIYINRRWRFRVKGARELPVLLKMIILDDLSKFKSNSDEDNNQLVRLRMLVDFIKLVVINFDILIKDLSTPAEV